MFTDDEQALVSEHFNVWTDSVLISSSNDRFTVYRRSNCVFLFSVRPRLLPLLPPLRFHPSTLPTFLPSVQEVWCHPSRPFSLSLNRPPPFSSTAIDHKFGQGKGRGIISGQLALCLTDSLQIRSSGKEGREGKKEKKNHVR